MWALPHLREVMLLLASCLRCPCLVTNVGVVDDLHHTRFHHHTSSPALGLWESSPLRCARNGRLATPLACPTHWAASASRRSCPTHWASGVATASSLLRPRSATLVNTLQLPPLHSSARSSESSALRCTKNGCLGCPAVSHPTHWATRLPRTHRRSCPTYWATGVATASPLQ